ncbi:ABC transporter permease [Ilumatobacter sp.]|uniref:ABC transporter permease n=1 Tax=Ilumatobacter sp. TaxID=1967498 RepID=UPI00375159AF
MIATIARHQILSLRRQRTFLWLLATFLVMTALAGVLGWSSHRTIVGVYDESVKLLATQGLPAPENPFRLKPTLSLLSNMVVYIPLIGALLAIVLGHISLADDETDGIGRLVFSRRINRTTYIVGKAVGAAVVLFSILAVSLAVSTLALVIVNRALPSFGEFGRLAGFYGLSLLYLMVFAFVGMATVLLTHRRSLALLTATGVWLVITFAVPQVTSGLRPTQSLNPITDPVSTSQAFFRATSKARPYSVVEQYKQISGQVLETSTVKGSLTGLLSIAALGLLLAIAIVLLVQRHDYSTGTSSD